MIKTKQLGIFACVAALVLIVSLSSSTVYAKDRQVVLLACELVGSSRTVSAVYSTDDDVLIALV